MQPLPTAAVHHPPGETLEVFATDDDGAVKVTWKRRNEPWQPPHELTRDGFVPSGSPVAAAYHPPGRTLEVFVVAARDAVDDAGHGAVHVIWKVENERWHRAVPITDPSSCPIPVGAHLAAVHHPPGETLEVFFVDGRGAVRVLWKRRNEHWQAPHRLTRDGFAPPGSPVAAVHYPPGRTLEAFVVALPEGVQDSGHGAVHVIWKVENEHWKGAVAITDPSECPTPVGAHVAAVHHPPGPTLEVFFVDTRAAPRVLWKLRNEPWRRTHRLMDDGSAAAGAPVAACHYPFAKTLEAFVAGNDAIWLLWKQGTGAWHPPYPLTEPGSVGRRTPVAAAYHPPGETLEVFLGDPRVLGRVIWKHHNLTWVPCAVSIAPRSGGTPVQPSPGATHLATMRVTQVTGGPELANAGVLGVDLGANTDHDGKQLFFFGDVPRGPRTVDPPHDADLVAYARTLTPGALELAPVLDQYGMFAPFTVLWDGAPSIPLTNQTPTGAFSHAGKAYVFVLVFEGAKGESLPTWVDGAKVVSLLTSSSDPASGQPFELVLRLSESKFWQVAPWVVRNSDHPGLPPESTGMEHGVIMLAGGHNPQSNADAVHLAWMPLPVQAQNPRDRIRYYRGPPDLWTSDADEAAAVPLWQLLPGYTSVSVAWIEEADRWVALYSKALHDPPRHHRARRPIVARIAPTLADLAHAKEIVAFDPCREAAYGSYMHWPDLDPLHAEGSDRRLGWPQRDPGWAYGAFIVAPLTRWDPEERTLMLSYLMSTSRPYQVQLMRSWFQVP
jgi:hypothetical protein